MGIPKWFVTFCFVIFAAAVGPTATGLVWFARVKVIQNKGDAARLFCKAAMAVLVLSVMCTSIHGLFAWAQKLQGTNVSKRIRTLVKWTLLLTGMGFTVGFMALLYVLLFRGMPDQIKKISLICGTCGCGVEAISSVLYFLSMLWKSAELAPTPTVITLFNFNP
ncbi:unnamed protein product [Cuscuta epithymum]|uniref:Uncharacterized protein n=1 Tax=Cuscuta epithymum TaxID=186058 RepID=A0AAV0F396_9ASTE|nr:unnamed protein product [Cuscuta epithymum]